ncbi:TetR/AcrR family transcriptional regulator [Epibacterium sp. MM17-32]|uniref:TetR/AcrR family transcriptional regulator n=1 Tax=Epibacterium sp. MM17-32 TaxID=2917734 RepID=UPI001EF47673|nr:TetR/AcrR family transcriptional regulator [Epibacterium sp. MM17-32]MCG7629256.1 TetR/AcrR family transcriptional regulator [Epibacterium sp. MM17-32]
MARTIAKDHDQKRALILSASARLFAEEGYDRASMTQIARACGISKANIYHYYEGKDALLFDLLDSYLRRLRDRVCQMDLSDLDPVARLRCILTEVLLAYEGADHEHKVQLNAISALPDPQQEHLRAYQREMVKFMSAAIRDAAPETLGADKGKLRAVTMSVFGMLNWHYMWNADADTEDRKGYADLVARLTLEGVAGL